MSTSPAREPPPPEQEQLELRRALVELHPVLCARARVLCSRLRPPTPSPDELVNEVVRRLLARYRDRDVDDARRLGFTVLARIACDVARGYRFDAGVIDDPPDIADPSQDVGDPLTRRALAELSEIERCVVTKIVIHDVAVPQAFDECGWKTPSAYFEYKKLLKRLRERLQGSATT